MNNYKVSICFGFVVMNIVVYLILAIYLDQVTNIYIYHIYNIYINHDFLLKFKKQVIPNEFGKKKHPLFFLDCFRSNNRRPISPKPRNKPSESASPALDPDTVKKKHHLNFSLFFYKK